jgi:hypothetical protein
MRVLYRLAAFAAIGICRVGGQIGTPAALFVP